MTVRHDFDRSDRSDDINYSGYFGCDGCSSAGNVGNSSRTGVRDVHLQRQNLLDRFAGRSFQRFPRLCQIDFERRSSKTYPMEV